MGPPYLLHGTLIAKIIGIDVLLYGCKENFCIEVCEFNLGSINQLLQTKLWLYLNIGTYSGALILGGKKILG